MTRLSTIAFLAALLAVATAAFAQQKLAQQKLTPSEVITALTLKAATLQENLDQSYVIIAQLQARLGTSEQSAAWVLDNWVPKAAETK